MCFKMYFRRGEKTYIREFVCNRWTIIPDQRYIGFSRRNCVFSFFFFFLSFANF